MLNDEYRYKLLKLIEAKPQISQRALAQELGISLGKVNYCLRALIEKGQVKANNFKNNKNKKAYIYILTPKGIEEKARVTSSFLKLKMQEYERLRAEIQELHNDVKVIQENYDEG